MAVARVLLGKDTKAEGIAFAVDRRLALTANHVLRGREAGSIRLVLEDGRVVPVDEVRRDEALDVAALYLGKDVPAVLTVGTAEEGAPIAIWARPDDEDPALKGRIEKTDLRWRNARGHPVTALQLGLDRPIGGYRGYSGSPVTLDTSKDVVVGVLTEQLPLRVDYPLGESVLKAAAPVLFAVPIQDALDRLGVTPARGGRPYRFDAPRPPARMVDRDRLWRQVLDALTVPGAEVVMVHGAGGMGKTVLAQQVANHASTWEAFPRGVVWRPVGRGKQAGDVLEGLDRQLGVGALSFLAQGEPALLVLDDVWSEDLVLEVRGQLPVTVRMLVTTRGLHLPRFASIPVETMSEPEALRLLAGGVPRTVELDAALAELASTFGHWPLVLDMAASHLHLADLGLAGIDSAAGATGMAAGALAERARELRKAFAEDPTALDDAGESLTRMIQLTLEGLDQPEDREGFRALAVYPPGVLLTRAILGGLWDLNLVATERRMRRLARAGLLTPVEGGGELLARLHDLVVAWLHRTHGDPDHHGNAPFHARAVRTAVIADGRPGDLAGRAEWLAYHLCRSGDPRDPARLLHADWRRAYHAATGSEAGYQKALRDVIAYYGAVDDETLQATVVEPVQAQAWLLHAALRHAHINAQVNAVPIDALIAVALAGQPEAALRRAVAYNDPYGFAREAMAEILGALAKEGELTDAVIDLAVELAEDVLADDALDVLTQMAHALEPHDLERALRLRRRAVERAEDGAETVAQLSASVRLAMTLACRDPHQTVEIAETVQRRADAIPNRGLGVRALTVVAEALSTHDPDAALRLVRRAQAAAEAITEEPVRSEALSLTARVMAPHEPNEAERLAGEVTDPDWRRWINTELTLAMAPSDPERARQLAGGITEPRVRQQALTAAARTLTLEQAAVARQLLEEAELLADGLTDSNDRDKALAEVAVAQAKIDPERARRLAGGITEPRVRQQALTAAARTLPPEQAAVARQLLEEAELLANSLSDRDKALADSDWDKALAAYDRKLLAAYDRDKALAEVAVAQANIDPERARRITDRISWDRQRGDALAAVAEALASTDSAAAATVAETAPDGYERVKAITAIVKALAPSDPDGAERLAGTLSAEDRREALAALAHAVAVQDRRRALRLVGQVEDLAEAMPDRGQRGEALAALAAWLTDRVPDVTADLTGRALDLVEVSPDLEAVEYLAQALAPHDPARTERLAELDFDDGEAPLALDRIGRALVLHDPEAARRVFLSLVKRNYSYLYLFAIPAATDAVRMLAAGDFEEAQRFLHFIPLEDRGPALEALVEGVASVDAARAEKLATEASWFVLDKVRALSRVAETLAARDPAHARQIARRAQWWSWLLVERSRLRVGLTSLARGWTPLDPGKARRLLAMAQRLAEQLPDKDDLRGFALHDLAEALAPLDPDLAWNIANAFTRDRRKWALASVAKVLAVRDVGKAAELFQDIPDPSERADIAVDAAKALVAHNLEAALELVQAGPGASSWQSDDVLVEAVRRLAGLDLARARRLAESVSESGRRNELLGLTAGWAGSRAALAGMTAAWRDPADALWAAKGFVEGRSHTAPETVRTLAESVRDAVAGL